MKSNTEITNKRQNEKTVSYLLADQVLEYVT